MVKSMCKEANIEGQFTNHSLCATGATELFRNNVPEKVIQEFTGHRSVKCLRQYEKPSMEQKMCASNVLTKCDEGSTSGTTHSSLDVLPYKPSLPCLSSQSDTGSRVPVYSTCNMQFPSFAPVFSNQGAVNFTVNICPSGVINHTKDKDDVDCDKLLDGIQLEDLL